MMTRSSSTIYELADRLREIIATIRSELAQMSRSLQEISLLLDQSASEAERLNQRELQASARLREIEANLEAYSRSEIRDAFRQAHEVTIRLFMMRNQAEQLQERYDALEREQERLRRFLELAERVLAYFEEQVRAAERRTRLLGDATHTLSLDEVILAEEAERRRVARQIIDGPAQALSTVLLDVELCEQLLARQPDDVPQALERLRETIARALLDTRRLLYELRPPVLEELGLTQTLKRYLSELARLYGFTVELTGPEHDTPLTPAIQLALYRLLQELTGVLAATRSLKGLTLSLQYEPAQAVAILDVQAPGEAMRQAIAKWQSPGSIVTERLERLGASFSEESQQDEQTRFRLLVPLA